MAALSADDPRSYNMPPADAFGPDKIDDLGRAILTLTKEVCVLADRQAVLETMLEEAGVTNVEALDTYQPNEAAQARIDAKMQAIISSVLGEMWSAE